MHDYGLWGTVPTVASDYPRAKPDSVGVPPQSGETVLVAPFNDTRAVVEMIERHAHELAAVIVEPLQRVLLPEPGFLEAVREATRRPRHRAGVRRDRDGLSHRVGRRATEIRRRSRSRLLRQGRERRLSARRNCRVCRRDGRARRKVATALPTSSGPPIR
jgi:hypothetical protein